MKTTHTLKIAMAAALCCASFMAHADDTADTTTAIDNAVKKALNENGIQLFGYMRGGFYSAPAGQLKGGYALGGDLQKFRLGNEGDNYIEFGISKVWNQDGVKSGVYYMPSDYNGTTATKQLYADISGLSFAPNLSFWAGQRYHRIEDIHIIDHFLMQDGDNYGAGVDGIAVGQSAKLNLALHTDGSFSNNNTSTNNAKRFNFQLRDLPLNPGGTLTVIGSTVNGTFNMGSGGNALGLLHKQSNFLTQGLNNSLFIQTSSGHANLDGGFYNLDANGAAQAGARQSRIADSINWQVGRFGGQAFVSYQTVSPDNAAHYKDTSIGGRVSYGIDKNVKLLAELGLTSRAIDGQATQHLNKATVAVAFSPDTNFWTRPEFRLYVSNFNWNAAALANNPSFSTSGKLNSNTIGAQLEYWW